MEKEFIPYEEALELKVLGFDEPCFGYYEMGSKIFVIYYDNNSLKSEERKKRPELYEPTHKNSSLPQWAISMPLYQQALRWLRTKNLYFEIRTIKTNEEYEISVEDKVITRYKTYEEAELACLITLIEILKNN